VQELYPRHLSFWNTSQRCILYGNNDNKGGRSSEESNHYIGIKDYDVKMGDLCHPKCKRCISLRDMQNKQMESLAERQCAGCILTKKAKEFDNHQIKMGKKSLCIRCSATLACSVCNVSKDKFDSFDLVQRGKKSNAKCKVCNTRQCAHCTLIKNVKEFSKDQLKRGNDAFCMVCINNPTPIDIYYDKFSFKSTGR